MSRNKRLISIRLRYAVLTIGIVHDGRIWSSYKVCVVDALALEADEGRDKLRKAAGSCKYALIRGYPNRETVLVERPRTVG